MIGRIIPIFTPDAESLTPNPTTWTIEQDNHNRPSASTQVFSVGELCESILLHADPADIIRCRAVNHKLYETVTYSKKLRQKLFLEADHQREPRCVNALAPTWFTQQPHRTNTIGVRLDLHDLWTKSLTAVRPLWQNMLVSQPPATSCVISVGEHMTTYFQKSYPNGMTFGDLEKAVIAAFEIRKGRKSTPEWLNHLSDRNSVLIYLPTRPTS